MGNLGMPELMMIMLLALLLFGPKKLPEIGKQVGKALGEFKRASNDLKRSIEDEMEKANVSADLKGIMDPPKTDPKPVTRAPVLAEGAVSQEKVVQEKAVQEKAVEATKPS
ncbi:MAG TPA: twin-arginine translocase TatA/TatE family subunit [Thermoanaerobaculia bacterium]